MLTGVEDISLSVGAPVYTEGETAQFSVHLSPPADEIVSLGYEVVAHDVPVEEYSPTGTGTISFAIDEALAPFPIELFQDFRPEGNYVLELRITSINGEPIDLLLHPQLTESVDVRDDDSITEGPFGPGEIIVEANSLEGNEGTTIVISGTILAPASTLPSSVTITRVDDGSELGTAPVAEDGSYTWSWFIEDDNPTDTPQDEVTLKVTATLTEDEGGGSGSGSGSGGAELTVSATITLQLINVAPQITAALINPSDPEGPGDQIGDGGQVQLEITITDPGVTDTFQLHVQWGDGTDDVVEVTTNDGEPIILDHEYPPRPNDPDSHHVYPIEVEVIDDDTGVGSASGSVVAVKGTAGNKPDVWIVATDPQAKEIGPDSGWLSLHRSGSTASNLGVYITYAGDASKNWDYKLYAIINGTRREIWGGLSSGNMVTIPAGQSSIQLEVVPYDDQHSDGGTEDAVFNVSPFSYSDTPYIPKPGQSSATVSIEDSNGFFSLRPYPYAGSLKEDLGVGVNGHAMVVEVRYHGSLPGTHLNVPIVLSGSADATDYTVSTRPSGEVEGWVEGQVYIDWHTSSGLVWIKPTPDFNIEGDESVIVSLDLTGITVGGVPAVAHPDAASAIVTILDDEPTIIVEAVDPNANEVGSFYGDPGKFKVSRSSGSKLFPINVEFTIGGTATMGLDYTWNATPFPSLDPSWMTGSVVTIPAGQESFAFSVLPVLDAAPEENETVVLTMSPFATLYHVGEPSQATVTIKDNDQVLANWELIETSWPSTPAGFYLPWVWIEAGSGEPSRWE